MSPDAPSPEGGRTTSPSSVPRSEEVRVYPSSAAGILRAPPSKSYTHRALVAMGLAPSGGRVLDPLLSEDISASLRALRALGGGGILSEAGTEVGPGPNAIEVRPIDRGPGSARLAKEAEAFVQVGESGTTLRFFAAVASLGYRPLRFEGRPGLARRPMEGLLEALVSLGAKVEGPPAGLSLPFTISGPLHAGKVVIPGSVSSQFVSALLLALPTLPGASDLTIAGPRVSEPYVAATERILRAQGVELEVTPHGYHIPGGQTYRGGQFSVPGDASSAAYLLALGALTGGPVKVTGLPSNDEWPQADLAILKHLTAAGARVRQGPKEVEVARDAFPLRPIQVDLDPSPDLAPLLAVLASFSEGPSELTGGAHLASKESDRRKGVIALAQALGARASDEGTALRIRGPATAKSLELTDLQDHRLLFAACVAAAALPEPSRLGPALAAAKSYPRFFQDIQALGVRVEPATALPPHESVP
jgi:3-phosphoshikimate 1-carboxyvinyltransferase